MHPRVQVVSLFVYCITNFYIDISNTAYQLYISNKQGSVFSHIIWHHTDTEAYAIALYIHT